MLMKCLLIIHKHMSDKQLEHAFLMCLAWLNFDYPVDVVAMDGRLSQLLQEPETAQQWQSLGLYGIKNFYQLSWTASTSASDLITAIDSNQFDQLKQSAQVIL